MTSPVAPAGVDAGRDSRLLAEGLKEIAGSAPLELQVNGDCMAPRLRAASRITVAPRRRYWPGDILAFTSATGELRVHRLIGFRRRRGRLLLQTRADASGTLDAPIAREQVIGRIVTGPRAARVRLGDRLAAVARFLRLRYRGVLPG